MQVDTYWDLGIDDMTSVWFCQSLRGRHRMIDYYEVCGQNVAEVLRDIRTKGYDLGEFVLPHDAKTRSFQSGESTFNILWNLGVRKMRVVPRCQHKRDSINAARLAFSKVEFDKKKCKRGLECLANYQRKWNSKNNVFEEAPLHNWASNGADAFQQFALGTGNNSWDRSEMHDRRFDRMPTQSATEYEPFAPSTWSQS